MARKARCSFISNVYHLMVQGDEKKSIFDLSANKRKYLYFLKHDAFKNDVDIISYCMMDNHAHVLVYCPEIERISQMMHECNTSYAIFYNKKRNKVGHVFRDRFKSEGIYTKSHLINCIKYIHENPVKAGICDRCDQYMFSSYNAFKNTKDMIKQICELSKHDMNEIMKNTYTDTKYMDDDYSKEDIQTVAEDVLNKYLILKDDDNGIAKAYKELKERCRISDTEIANILGINRYSLIRRLKKMGLK